MNFVPPDVMETRKRLRKTGAEIRGVDAFDVTKAPPAKGPAPINTDYGWVPSSSRKDPVKAPKRNEKRNESEMKTKRSEMKTITKRTKRNELSGEPVRRVRSARVGVFTRRSSHFVSFV